MSDIVDQTLKLWRSTPLEWGTSDCLMSIANYVVAKGGRDGLARFRGTYSDEAGAMAHVAANGGICGLMGLFGLPSIDIPGRGDILALDTGEYEVGALCTGSGVAARLVRGTIEVEMRLIKIAQAWKVG